MKYTGSVLIFFALFTPSVLFAQSSFLLEGTIGTYPVVMNLNYDDSSCGASYFYKSRKGDIQMNGRADKGSLTLSVLRWNTAARKEDTAEILHLNKESATTFSGTWENNKNNHLPVALHTVNLKTTEHPFGGLDYIKSLKIEEPYEYMRTASMRLIKDSVVKKDKYTLEYVHIDNSPVWSFHITEGADKQTTDKINALLDNAILEHADRSFSCVFYEYSVNNLVVSGDVISLNVVEQYDCGGAHPDYENLPLNIDTRTGKKMELEDILYFSNIKVPPAESDEWLSYRSSEFGPKLVALLKQLYPKEMNKKEPCVYAQEDRWCYPKWYFTETGVYVSPEFPHVVATCRDPKWSVIPYSTLKKYKNPDINIELPE